MIRADEECWWEGGADVWGGGRRRVNVSDTNFSYSAGQDRHFYKSSVKILVETLIYIKFSFGCVAV